MNWKDFWNTKQADESPLAQVGRVVQGEAMGEEMLQKIALKIATQLQLQSHESLLDVCCGNGLLDTYLLKYAKHIHGVDLSEKLIANASSLASSQLQFTVGNASNFGLNQTFDKTLLYFSFQYIETLEDATAVMRNLLAHTKPGGRILIGDIPNQLEFFSYYNSLSKCLSWIKQELKNANEMGRFWHPKELLRICESLGVKAEIQAQEPWQPYAHYRFDLLVYS